MAARRLIAVLIVLLVISSIAAALAPTPDEQASESSTTTTEAAEASGAEADRGRSRTITATVTVPAPSAVDEDADADAHRRPKSEPKGEPEPIEIAVGDRLALEVRSAETLGVEIQALGRYETAAAGAPARFDLLLREPAELAVTVEGRELPVAMIVATDGTGDQDDASDRKGGRDKARGPAGDRY